MPSHTGLDKWFKQDWVDIGSKKKGGGFAKCGRSKQKKDAKRKYPKCVPRAKANAMTEGQRRSAVSRKRSKAQGVGGKPTNVATFKKRKKAAEGGYIGSFVDMNLPLGRGEYKRIGNPSLKKYYKTLGII
tara:strand:+ start:409 stop:798 length:390 start_codon:yes stop_codon:yes gene_type:complete